MTSDLFTWPQWAQMWALALAIFAACKWVTWRTAAVAGVPAWKHAAYFVAWPGMDATNFLSRTLIPSLSSCRTKEWLAAAARLAIGATMFFGIARLIPPAHDYLIGWIGMIGLVLMLHFGAFHLLSCGWRGVGVEARALMHRPLASTSLSEFWGRRWNTAFRDLTYRFLFRPCAAWFGARGGVLAGFLFSGVIHDLVISVPARGGYGGPTVFFVVQGAAMVFERSGPGRRLGLGAGWRGRSFTFAILIAPLGLLFHPPFVVGIIVPFMRAVKAI